MTAKINWPAGRVMLLVFGLVAFWSLACEQTVTEDPHFNAAQNKLFEIDTVYSDTDYSRPEYLEIINELEQVSPEYVRTPDPSRACSLQ